MRAKSEQFIACLSSCGLQAVIVAQNEVIAHNYVVEGSCLYLTEGSRHHLESLIEFGSQVQPLLL